MGSPSRLSHCFARKICYATEGLLGRINIEDKLHKDSRFIELCIVLGSRRMALGALVEAWIFAQNFVTPENPRALFEAGLWKKHKLADEIIEVGLAVPEGEQIYIVGSEEQFKWLVQRQIASKKGGSANAAKHKHESRPEADREPASATGTEPSSSFSSSGSQVHNSSKLTNSVVETPRKISDPLGDHMRLKNSEREVRDRLLASYPNKRGWHGGWVVIRPQLADNPSLLTDMEKAVRNYRQECIDQKRATEHIKTFARFFTEKLWLDYINPEKNEDFSKASSIPDPELSEIFKRHERRKE